MQALSWSIQHLPGIIIEVNAEEPHHDAPASSEPLTALEIQQATLSVDEQAGSPAKSSLVHLRPHPACIGFLRKPNGFFDRNPSNDIPPSKSLESAGACKHCD